MENGIYLDKQLAELCDVRIDNNQPTIKEIEATNVFWFTGQAGAGKTVIGQVLFKMIEESCGLF